MDEREITERICKLFEDTVPVLHDIYKGFMGQKLNLLKESRTKFRESLIATLPGVEKMIEDTDKNAAEQMFLKALPHFQRIALALDNLVDKMEIKVESNILFTDKALDEIKELMIAVAAEFVDVKDYVSTRNPVLKKQIADNLHKVTNLINGFDSVHQNRLISGVCMPQASYLYIDMTDSLKRMSRELSAFAELLSPRA
jgi:Na+/phosphate symporter